MDVAALGLSIDSTSARAAAQNLDAMTQAGARSEQKAATVSRAWSSGFDTVHTGAQRLMADYSAMALQQQKTNALLEQQISATREVTNALNAQAEATKRATGATREQAEALGTLKMAAAGVGAAMAAAFVVKQVIAVTASLYEASAAAQRLRTTLDFASGGGGQRELAYVTKAANDLGLELQGTARAYAQLQAAAKGTSLEGQGARNIFEAVSKASAVMGLSAEQSSGALLALQQMISKGTVQSEELRGQLGERLPGAFQIASRAMGVTTQELGKMLEQGLVPASEFLPKFAAQLEKELGDSATKAADRLDAATARLENAWNRVKQTLGDSGIAEFAKGQIGILTDGLNSVTERMTAAKASGDGFIGQMASGAGAVLQFLNPLNALSYSAQGLEGRTKDATAELAKMQKQLDSHPTVPYFLKLRDEAAAYLRALQDAKRAQDALTSGVGGGRGFVNPETTEEAARKEAERRQRFDSYFNNNARQSKEQIRQEETSKAIANAEKFITENKLNQVDAMRVMNALSQELVNINDKYKDKTGPKAKKESTDDIANLEARIAEQEKLNAALKAGGDATDKMNEGEKLAEKHRKQALADKDKSAKAHDTELAKMADRLGALQRENEAILAIQKAQEKLQDARDKEAQAHAKYLQDANARAEAIENEIKGVTNLESATRRLTASRRDANTAAISSFFGGGPEADQLINDRNDESDADRRLARAQEMKLANDKAVEQFKKLTSENEKTWDKFTDNIGRGLTDSLYRAIESGGKFFKNVFTAAANTIKVSAAKLGIEGGLGFAASLAGLATGAVGTTGSGGPGVLGMLSGANNIYSAAGLANVAYQGGINGLIGTYAGSGSIAGTVLGTTAFSPSVIGAANLSGDAIGYIGATAAGTTGGAAGGVGAGGMGALGSVGTAIPYVAAVLAVMNAAGLFRSKTTTDTGVMGNVGYNGNGVRSYTETRTGGTLFSGPDYRTNLDTVNSPYVAVISQQVNAVYDSTVMYAKALGLSAETVKSYVAEINLSLKDLTPEQAAQKIAVYFQGLAGTLTNFIGDAIVGEGDSKHHRLLDFSKSGELADQTLARLATSLMSVNELFRVTGQSLFTLSLEAGDAASRMIDAAGSFDNLQGLVGSYVKNYKTDAEQQGLALAELARQFSALGVAVPKTREDFSRLVESAHGAGAAGADLYVALLKLGDAFAAVTPTAEDAAATVRDGLLKTFNAAYSALQRSISDEKDALAKAWEKQNEGFQKTIDTLASGVSTLDARADRLRSTLASMALINTEAQTRRAAQDFVSAALAMDPSKINDADLQTALGTLSKDASQSFATYQQYALDFAKTNADIAALEQNTDKAKTIAQQQLDATLLQQSEARTAYDNQVARLDGILLQAATINDSINGTTTAIGTVAQMLAQFNAASRPLGGGVVGGAAAGGATGGGSGDAFIQGLYQSVLGREGEAAGVQFYRDQLASGISQSQILAQFLASPEAQGLPKFAAGGYHAGGWAMVGENGPEAAYFDGPARIYNATQTGQMMGQGSAEVVLLLRGINSKLDGQNIGGDIEAIASDMVRVRTVLEGADDEGNGLLVRVQT